MILHGDALMEIKKIEDNSIDTVVTDPPYGYTFMGKDWDKAVPPVEIWKECIRVLKPGAFCFIMSAPRSDVQAEMIHRIQKAGFRTDFTPIYWTYATGFPKAVSIRRKLEKKKMAEKHLDLTDAYSGYQPKPAVEVIIVAMKPMVHKTYMGQALDNGKGITHLDNVRIPFEDESDKAEQKNKNPHTVKSENKVYGDYSMCQDPWEQPGGRFPANLIVSDDMLDDGKITESKSGGIRKPSGTEYFGSGDNWKEWERQLIEDSGTFSRYFSIDAWFNEKVYKKLPKGLQKTMPFMIVPKASQEERNAGCSNVSPEFLEPSRREGSDGGTSPFSRGAETRRFNYHPTVKPIQLMSYLITLATKERETVLDPFMGSGSTLIAAKILNRKGIGIERDYPYIVIAKARLKIIKTQLKLFPE